MDGRLRCDAAGEAAPAALQTRARRASSTSLGSTFGRIAFATDHLWHSFRLWPVWRTICLIGVPLFDRAKLVALVLFAANVSFMLQAFSRGEKFGIDGCRPDCAVDLAQPVKRVSKKPPSRA